LRKEVKLRLSGDLFGGNPRGLLGHLELNGRHLGEDWWSVWPVDNGSFMSLRDLADEAESSNRFDLLKDVPDPVIRLDDDPEIVRHYTDLHEQLTRRMTNRSDITAPFHKIQADLAISTNGDELISIVRDAYDNIRQVSFETSGERAFPHPSAHLISSTDLLIRRARLPGIMFRFDQDPDALKTRAAISEEEGGHFDSQAAWYREVIGVVHYLGPLLGCLSPRFWCLPTGRPPFAILFNLGRDISGLRSSPMEPMQLLPEFGRMEPVPPAELTPTSCRHAIHWWTTRLNQMFRYLCDPTTFRNVNGEYDPYEHQHWLLTFGQVFGLTTALQASGRNHAVQRALMNTLLDTYADRIRIGGRGFERLCTWQYAKKAADRVHTRMPDDVAAILMPVADRAVESLRRFQEGFFIRRQRRDKNVIIRIPGEHPEHLQPEQATAVLLKVLRNATHGFGGRDPQPATKKELIAERLLAHHDGEMPADLVFLPYLYLLDALSQPEQVRETIAKRISKRQPVTST